MITNGNSYRQSDQRHESGLVLPTHRPERETADNLTPSQPMGTLSLFSSFPFFTIFPVTTTLREPFLKVQKLGLTCLVHNK